MSSLGMTGNYHLDAVEDVCTKHSDLCLAVMHMPIFFQILDWNISLLNDHFLEPDGVHPNALTQGLIGKFAFEIVTQNTHDPNMSPNKLLAVPVGKQVYCPSPTQNASRLSAQVDRLLFGHYPAASFVSESPCNVYIDKVPSENVSSFFLAPLSMLKPTNLADLDIVSVGKALPTRMGRKYEIQLSSCINSSKPNPMFNLSNFTSMRHEDPYSSGSGRGVAFAGFEIGGQEQRAKFEPLGADRIHVIIGLANGTRREITPAEMFTVPKDSEFQYTWMDLSSVYVIFDTPMEMDSILICRNPTFRENLRVTLVQLVLYI